MPDQFIKGLSIACLQGRAQIVPDPQVSSECKDINCPLVFYLDGAHSPESMEICANWFSHVTKKDAAQPGPLEQPRGGSNSKKVCYALLWQPFRLNQCLNGLSLSHTHTHSLVGCFQILLFNCMSVRDPQRLLPRLLDTCAQKGMLIEFCVDVSMKILTMQCFGFVVTQHVWGKQISTRAIVRFVFLFSTTFVIKLVLLDFFSLRACSVRQGLERFEGD